MKRTTRSRSLTGDDDRNNGSHNVDSDNEVNEEEESTSDRRAGLRKRQKVDYMIWTFEDVDDEEDDDEEDDEDEEEGDDDNEDEDEEQDEEDEGEEEDKEGEEHEEEDEHDQMTLENSCLHVTCETKKGFLDTEKLRRGEACIERKGRWFTPAEFEDFAGRGSAKKWKTSIFYKSKPLQYYFEKCLLTTKGYKKGPRDPKKTKTRPSGRELPLSGGSEEDSNADTNDSEEGPLVIEDTEDEMVGAESDGEVRDSESKEEEEEKKNEEMEDEEVTAVANIRIDSSVPEECIQSIVNAFCKRGAKKMKAKVVVKRLPEEISPADEVLDSSSCAPSQARSDDQTNSTEHPVNDSLCQPFKEDALSDSEREYDSSATVDLYNSPVVHVDSPRMSDPLITEGVPGPSTTRRSLRFEKEDPGHTDVTNSGLDAAQSQVINGETGVLRTPAASNRIPCAPVIPPPSEFSDIAEASDVDIDQLKREKLKMQLKVLKLQEEYYKLKIKTLKKWKRPTGD